MKKESVENAMKSLFGEDKSGEYRKFISENWELNEEETIAKWIENVTKWFLQSEKPWSPYNQS